MYTVPIYIYITGCISDLAIVSSGMRLVTLPEVSKVRA